MAFLRPIYRPALFGEASPAVKSVFLLLPGVRQRPGGSAGEEVLAIAGLVLGEERLADWQNDGMEDQIELQL